MNWLFDFARFALFYVKEVVFSNLVIAWDILTPASRAKPGFLVLEIGHLRDFQILMLTNLITMTPGTLSFELSADRTRLLIHVMYLPDEPEQLVQHLRERYLKPVIRLF